MKLRNLPYVFLSSTHFGKEILESLISHNCPPKAIFSIPEYFSISYSKTKVKNCNYYDFQEISQKYSIPLYIIESGVAPLTSFYDVIHSMQLDFMLVAGWYYKIPKSIYSLCKFGSFGFHNSLLPKYAGGAPLVWAIINGETQAGVSLFRMEEGMDSGAIILQESFSIESEDTIAEVLKKATSKAKEMSLKLFRQDFEIVFKEQESPQEYYPQRTPNDGEIDLKWDALSIYNFIRAQSSPYPGAFIKTIDGKKLIIDKAHIENFCGGGGILLSRPKIFCVLRAA